MKWARYDESAIPGRSAPLGMAPSTTANLSERNQTFTPPNTSCNNPKGRVICCYLVAISKQSNHLP